MPDCRLIVDGPADGVWNMAVDEALLESAAERGIATLRFYEWSEPTLSLGYFQSHAERAGHPPSLDCPCVRRMTGGGAIVHDQELTYSFAVPLPAQAPLDGSDLYRLFHQTLVEALASSGSPIRPGRWCDRPEGKHVTDGDLEDGSVGGERKTSPPPFLCFQRRSGQDVVLGQDKIAGSAQRKRRGAILQHGSALLRRSAAAPELPGWSDMAAFALSTETLRARWIDGLMVALGDPDGGGEHWRIPPVLGDCRAVLTPGEVRRADALRVGKYGQLTWNERK